MDIYNLLPSELQNKVKYYVLEHPAAKIIKEEIERIRCDEYYVFRGKNGKVFCKVDGRDFFCNEYFRQFNKNKDDNDSDTTSGDGSATSDEYLDEIFERMFMVSSSTSSDEEG
jgi:hypothetical protein